jgi:hypothetical protein
MRLPSTHPKARIVDEESLTAITRLGQRSGVTLEREYVLAPVATGTAGVIDATEAP